MLFPYHDHFMLAGTRIWITHHFKSRAMERFTNHPDLSYEIEHLIPAPGPIEKELRKRFCNQEARGKTGQLTQFYITPKVVVATVYETTARRWVATTIWHMAPALAAYLADMCKKPKGPSTRELVTGDPLDIYLGDKRKNSQGRGARELYTWKAEYDRNFPR